MAKDKEEQPKHKGEYKYKHIPKFAKKIPGKGKHGVPDKAVHKMNKKDAKKKKD